MHAVFVCKITLVVSWNVFMDCKY